MDNNNTQSEIWKEVEGYNGVYLVSNFGRVKSIDRVNAKGAKVKGKILKSQKNTSGYNQVSLYNGSRSSRKVHFVHRLVAKAFIDGEKDSVNHIDGNKDNNNVDNLEWVTKSENTVHAYENGLMKRCKKVFVTLPNGKLKIFHNTAECSRYFGFSNTWVSDRVKKHGNKFEYNNHVIEVKAP